MPRALVKTLFNASIVIEGQEKKYTMLFPHPKKIKASNLNVWRRQNKLLFKATSNINDGLKGSLLGWCIVRRSCFSLSQYQGI